MKRSERVHTASEDAKRSGACGIDPETLNQLKAEFHDFVANTKRRLATTSDQLRELDREPPSNEAQDTGVSDSDVDQESTPTSVSQRILSRPVLSETEESADFRDANSIWSSSDSGDEFGSSPLVAAPSASEPAQPEDTERTESTVPLKAEKINRTAKVPPEVISSPTVGPDSSLEPIDTDSDPLERLNAIKARLAKQIEQA